MGMNVTNIFIRTACNALANSIHKLSDEQRENLFDELVKLCRTYVPNAFADSVESEEKPKRDISQILDDMFYKL